MDDMDYLHQPKGSMCMACDFKALPCGHLDFASMPVLERRGRSAIVRCTAFKRSTQAAAGEAEFASWRQVLLENAEVYCPGSGLRHVVDTTTPPPGTFGVCMRCGHSIELPF